MGTLAEISNVGIVRHCYVNEAVSNIVTNTTTETAFDQFWTLKSGFGYILNATARIYAQGTISTGLLNLGFTFRIRWGGTGTNGTVIGSSGGIALASSVSDGGWYCNAVITVRDANTAGGGEMQAQAGFQAGAVTNIPLAMPNTGNFAAQWDQENNVHMTAQWNTASSANKIQLRSMVVDWDRT